MGVMHTFATRFKELREEAGLSQEKLANDLNISRGTISYYEKEERTPDIVTLDKVAKYFAVPADYLLGYIDTKEIENINIGIDLGLSDKAISFLRDLSEIKRGLKQTYSTSKLLKDIENLYNTEKVKYKDKESQIQLKKIFDRNEKEIRNEDIMQSKLISDTINLILENEFEYEFLKNAALYIFTQFPEDEFIKLSASSDNEASFPLSIHYRSSEFANVSLVRLGNILHSWKARVLNCLANERKTMFIHFNPKSNETLKKE